MSENFFNENLNKFLREAEMFEQILAEGKKAVMVNKPYCNADKLRQYIEGVRAIEAIPEGRFKTVTIDDPMEFKEYHAVNLVLADDEFTRTETESLCKALCMFDDMIVGPELGTGNTSFFLTIDGIYTEME